ncbi:MAG: DUF2442 domain-containing protein, partial [Prochloron sp. SP5CPC1]|nr:DUF2442 domain-containing protein [Candidatus Paraprochloron terpiosi SP5CPC1]
MGILAPEADERVQGVYLTEDTLRVDLMDGRTITVSLAWYPRLLHATPEQLGQWEICGGGYGIHWEVLVDILPSPLTLREGIPKYHYLGFCFFPPA